MAYEYRLPIVALPLIYKINREGGGTREGVGNISRASPGAQAAPCGHGVGHGYPGHQVGTRTASGLYDRRVCARTDGHRRDVSANGFRLSHLRAPFRSPPQGKIRFPKPRHCCASSCMCYIAHRFIDEGLMDTIINVLLIFLALTGGVWWFVMLGLMFFYWLNHRRD